MKFEIKSRWDGRILFSIETDSLKLAVEAAVRSGASLDGARLDGASLVGARLVGASLVGASLDGARLDGASLVGARLVGARGVNKHRCVPLLMLLDQPGKIRAYKLVNASGEGPFNGGIVYKVGKSYSVKNADTTDEQCGAGINVATLDWCMREWRTGYKILVVEFTAKDIASIPLGTDGKFRLHRCKVVGEKSLKEIGLVKK